MHEPIHIGNQTKVRKVTSAVATVIVTPLAIVAGIALMWYALRGKERNK
jgi:hypothetical protein